MKTRNLFQLRVVVAAYALLAWTGCNKTQPPATPAAQPVSAETGWRRIERPGKLKAGALPSQILASLAGGAPDKDWKPKVAAPSRAPSLAIYPKVAPAVVVVRIPGAHGTGFIIDQEGWIVTNLHVIGGGAPDPKTGAGTAMIHLGQIHEGWMKLREEPIPAVVYTSSVEKDLALLKLERLPQEIKELPVIGLADGVPAPGSDCVAIGHPAAGVLWTVRSGEVAGQAVWPQDELANVLAVLSASPDDRKTISQSLAQSPRRKILLSSCGVNPGDSGGPLFDREGRLIAVTFAIPTSDEAGISFDKFSYHVHLDEVKEFVAQRPKAAEVLVPDSKPVGHYHELVDVDNDGEADAVVFGMAAENSLTGALVKLKSDDTLKSLVSSISSPGEEPELHFEFAQKGKVDGYKYLDINGDGTLDLVLTDVDGDDKVDSSLRLTGEIWKPESTADRSLFDAAHFSDKKLAARFLELELDKRK